jgi:type II secretory pathway component PulK
MRRGAVLIVTLLVMLTLSLTCVSLAHRARVRLRDARATETRVILERLNASAVAVAMAQLAEDDNAFDHPDENWSEVVLDEASPAASSSGDGGRSRYEVRCHVRDEEGKLNVAYASNAALLSLGFSRRQIACLRDWIDPDHMPGVRGAERDAYRALGYRCKNAPLQSLHELMAVKGFAGETDDPGEDRRGRNWDEVLTTRGDGRINVNTASRDVLATLPIQSAAVEQVLAYRNAHGRPLEQRVFRSPEDIDQLQGLIAADRAVLHQWARFDSDHFRIRVRSREANGNVRQALDVLVCDFAGEVQVLEWRRAR